MLVIVVVVMSMIAMPVSRWWSQALVIGCEEGLQNESKSAYLIANVQRLDTYDGNLWVAQVSLDLRSGVSIISKWSDLVTAAVGTNVQTRFG